MIWRKIGNNKMYYCCFCDDLFVSYFPISFMFQFCVIQRLCFKTASRLRPDSIFAKIFMKKMLTLCAFRKFSQTSASIIPQTTIPEGDLATSKAQPQNSITTKPDAQAWQPTHSLALTSKLESNSASLWLSELFRRGSNYKNSSFCTI